MITKTQFCKHIINDFIEDNREQLESHGINLNCFENEELIPYVFQNSTLGVALEYLGVINPEDHKDIYEYIQSRGGIMFSYVNYMDPRVDRYIDELETAILSTREFISLLPD